MKETRLPSRFWVFTFLINPLVRLLFRYTLRGNVPLRGPVIIVANHNSELDPILFAIAIWRMGRKPYFMAKRQLFSVPALGACLRFLRQIPVTRPSDTPCGDMTENTHAPSLLTAIRRLRAGGVIVLYPEGSVTRHPELWLDSFNPGFVHLASLTGTPIICAAQWGAQKTLPYGKKLPKFGLRNAYSVVFCAPVHIPRKKLSDEEIKRFSNLMKEKINTALAAIRLSDETGFMRHERGWVAQ
ncbi:lysophospholipid acyltransferase family protein [Tropheryma whipplei]|uniref:Acyltransferase family protein n=1 Tax=Tropheryma whipplei (strain Twist) TaxID=203267 RepID=Q83G26_TROWT|nr:lysophospholipid acyltransferase family protein [Tropheryma whipplei]AAO44604.1 acyltransferase family protein [Tropheryma whipplei str. Twist]